MAAINFPNPGTQNPPNIFSPNSSPAKTKNGITYQWNGVGWTIRSTTGGGGDGGSTKVYIGDTAPGDSTTGDLWWDSGLPASLFIYYTDSDSSQWVPATPVTSGWYVNGGELVTAETDINVRVGGNITAQRINGGIDSPDYAFVGITNTSSYGTIYAENSATNGLVFEGNDPTGRKISLYADGSAYFLSDTIILDNTGGGRVVVGSTATNGPRVQLNQNGLIQSYTSNSDMGVISIYRDGTENITMNNNGTTTFKGKGTFDTRSGTDAPALQAISNSSDDSDAPVTAYNGNVSGGYLYAGYGVSNNLVWSVNNSGTSTFSNTILNLDPSNSANYNSSGEYTGATLDVKDRLQKSDAALTAIKAAVSDSNTDLAGLKASILAALVNH